MSTWEEAFNQWEDACRWVNPDIISAFAEKIAEEDSHFAAAVGSTQKLVDITDEVLPTAEPVGVHGDVRVMIDYMHGKFPGEHFHMSDLIVEAGFCWAEGGIPTSWEKPIDVAVGGHEDMEVPQVLDAVMWCPIFIEEEERQAIAIWEFVRQPHAHNMVLPVHWHTLSVGAMLPADDPNYTTVSWLQVLWKFMKHELTAVQRERVSRPARKRAARRGLPHDAVTVIRLRKRRTARRDPTGNSANYSHRFLVGGFYRNQWYPSLEAHKLIQIMPYIKGPEDKPLVLKDRAWEVVR